MSSLLVTGGAGFIGTNFVRLACDRKIERMIVVDRLTYAGNLANISDLIDAGRIEFVKGDICEPAMIDELFRKHDVTRVMHFAAESHVDRSILGPEEFLRTNVEGTYTLLEAARKAWQGATSNQRFVHVSTDEVYGSLTPDALAFTEDSPYRPSSPYSASKAASDHLARAWNHTYGLPVIVTNCSNNYGPWQFPEKLIPLAILNAVEERELPVYGDGLQVRDWLHVEDHCEALLCVLERGTIGQTYLVGGNCERPNVAIVQLICEAIDQRLGRTPGSTDSLVRHVADRPGHDRRYAVNASRLRDELGWMPGHTLEESLPSVIDWYLENGSWADDIRSGAYMNYYQQQYGNR